MKRVLRASTLLVLALLAAGTFSVIAQDSSPGNYYVVKVWGADEGFTESSVTDVNQTPEGYLWVGTLFGSVLRFDGVRFVSYTSANTPGFVSKWGVPRLMVDATGALWISMHDGGMTIWDKQGFRPAFSSTNQPGKMLWSGAGKVIFLYGGGRLLCGELQNEKWNWENMVLRGNQHCTDSLGHVWYLRNDHEIRCWNGTQTNVVALDPLFNGQHLKVLVNDLKGNIWVGSDKGVFEWQTNHFEDMTPTNGESVLDVRAIVPSGTDNLWIDANDHMRRCAARQWVAESEGWKSETSGVTPRFLHGDSEGGLWGGANDMGLIHVLEDGTFHRLTTRDGLPSDTVHFAFQDRDGNTWTGYERGGLVQIRRRLFRSVGKDQGLSDSLVNTVCEDNHGLLWIGTHSGKVNVYQNSLCTNLAFSGDARAQDSCIAADSNGGVWIGGQGIGLSKFEAGRVEQIASPAKFPEPANQNLPRLLLPARDGILWVGTLWTIIRVSGGALTTEYTALTPGEHPTSLAQAADGSIWAGTLAGFLLHWDGKQFVPVEPPDRNSLGRIWALWPSPDGALWAGTEEGGLLRWKNGVFQRYTTKDGLPSDSVIQILGDRQNNLWLGTRAGIVRISAAALNVYEHGNLKELPVSIYGQSDGLLTIGSAIISQPNCWRARDGELLFAMANSVAGVNPERVRVDPVAPSLTLEELRANEKTIWPTSPGAILTAPPLANTSESQASPFRIHIAPGRGDLEFQYAGPDLDSPSRVRFKYKLEGLENSWNEAGTDRKAVYRHVPPGDYVFRVMACNSDSVWSSDSALVSVTVAPFFYETIWFRTATGFFAVAGLSLALVSAYRRRVHRRLEQLERQHDLERERARIAQDLHDDLGAGLTEIGLLGGLLQKPSISPISQQQGLDRIVERCRDLVTALDEIVWALNPRNDSMNSLGGYLARYAQGFLEPTTIRCRLEIEEMGSPRLFNSEQRHNLFLAFKEALTNVARHSGATEVTIRVFLEKDAQLVVCIEDNGQGLPSIVRDSADGLINLRQRLARVGGDCEIKSASAGGVIVRMSLPAALPKKNK